MFQNSVCRNMFVAILLMTSLTSTIADVNRDEIRQKLQLHWDSIQSIEVEGKEYLCDEKWVRKPGTNIFEFEFGMQSGGRRELKYINIYPDGKKTAILWTRDDGKQLFKIYPFKNHLDVIDRITISKTTDTPNSFTTGMNLWLWSWLPRGHRMVDVIDLNTNLSEKHDPKWGDLVIVDTRVDRYPIQLELCKKYDYLPVRITLPNLWLQETLEFQNVKGIWLPAKGRNHEKTPTGGILNREFEAFNFKVNERIDKNRFQLPKLSPGSLVSNYTRTGPSGIYSESKMSMKELAELRAELESKFQPDESQKRNIKPVAMPIQVSRDPEPSYLGSILLGITLILLGSAVTLRIQLYRKSSRS